jgi:hypothetical protein
LDKNNGKIFFFHYLLSIEYKLYIAEEKSCFPYVHAGHVHMVHACAVHAHALHAQAPHTHSMQAHVKHAHAVHIQAVQSTFYM